MKKWLMVGLILCLGCGVGMGSVLAAEASWAELNKRATDFYKEQKFSKAVLAAEQALDYARKSPRVTREQLATSISNLAMLSTHVGKYTEAEVLNKEALDIRQKSFGENDPSVAVSWNNLGLVYYIAKKPEDAEICFKNALAVLENAYGKTDLRLVPALEKLQTYYEKLGKKEEKKAITKRLAGMVAVQ